MKICNKCLTERPVAEFSRDKHSKDGYTVQCKFCRRQSSKDYYQNNKEKVKVAKENYRKNNLEKFAEKSRNYRKTNPDKVKKSYSKWKEANMEIFERSQKDWYKRNSKKKKAYNLKKLYGISEYERENLIWLQAGLCLICIEPFKFDGAYKDIHIDHCHETGKIRGLLCTRCNVGIGNLRDDPVLCKAAADYIEQNK